MSQVLISQDVTSIVVINTPGPQGPIGPIGSTSSINTSNLATTGSNTFIGNQTITGSVISDNATGGQLFMHPQIITSNITIPANYNAFLFEPVSIAGTISVGSGSNLSIL